MPEYQYQANSKLSQQSAASFKKSTVVRGPVLQNNRNSHSANAVQRAEVVQRDKWEAAHTVAPGGLSAHLKAGYELAVAHPSSKPELPPDWVLPRVKLEHPQNHVKEDADATQKAIDKWTALKPEAQEKIRGNDLAQKAKKEKEWKDRVYKKELTTLQQGYEFSSKSKAKARWGSAKWNDAWGNNEKFLPEGQTYTEYYAEPSKGPHTDDKFFGKNRIVHSGAGGTYGNSWWASADHYENFVRVV